MPRIQINIVKGLYIESIIQSSQILFVLLNCFFKVLRMTLVEILIKIGLDEE